MLIIIVFLLLILERKVKMVERKIKDAQWKEKFTWPLCNYMSSQGFRVMVYNNNFNNISAIS